MREEKRAGSPERAFVQESDRFHSLGVRAARLGLKYFGPDDDPAPTHFRLLPFSRSRQAPPFFVHRTPCAMSNPKLEVLTPQNSQLIFID
ncbi:hypothetical protein, partial [Burkholderia cenocepacia]|uniref:hypothetical protein n=1 Tax=Burkholderia cenocepacia TaxID=95486 RepID=UPI001F26DF5D